MTSTFFLGRISKIGDGYSLRVGFLHIHGKFHEDPMKTLGCETKNVKNRNDVIKIDMTLAQSLEHGRTGSEGRAVRSSRPCHTGCANETASAPGAWKCMARTAVTQ